MKPGGGRRWRALPACLALTLLVVGCGSQSAGSTPPVAGASARYTTPRPADPFRREIVGEHPTEVALWTDLADAIVVGSVRQVLPAEWTTPDGRRPPNPHDPANAATIVTPVLVEVERSLGQARHTGELLVAASGGTVGEDSVARGDGLTTFREGERVLLFLQSRPRGLATQPGTPTWEVLERYTLTPENQASNAYRSATLAQLLAEIHAAQRRP